MLLRFCLFLRLICLWLYCSFIHFYVFFLCLRLRKLPLPFWISFALCAVAILASTLHAAMLHASPFRYSTPFSFSLSASSFLYCRGELLRGSPFALQLLCFVPYFRILCCRIMGVKCTFCRIWSFGNPSLLVLLACFSTLWTMTIVGTIAAGSIEKLSWYTFFVDGHYIWLDLAELEWANFLGYKFTVQIVRQSLCIGDCYWWSMHSNCPSSNICGALRSILSLSSL